MNDPNDPLGLGIPLAKSEHQRPVDPEAVQGLKGGALPQGIRVNYPNVPFPPEVREWLEKARKTGRYLFMCAIVDDDADNRGEPFGIYMHRSVGFDEDWILKAWKLFGLNIMALSVNDIGEKVEPPPGGQGGGPA